MKTNALKSGLLGVSLCVMSSFVSATPVDLSSWVAETGGRWVLQSGNNAVLQTINGEPTVFHNNQDSQGQSLSGTIEVQPGWDDDFIGFVLGYHSGDLQSTTTDYMLIDWKRGNQGSSRRGLSISRVTGALDDTNDSGAWVHDSTDGVEELQRATTLGDMGWAFGTSYAFDLIFTASLIEVYVDGNRELSVSGTFNNGSFGFYNYSQNNVLYAGIQQDVVTTVPLPATAWLMTLGLAGFVGLRRKV